MYTNNLCACNSLLAWTLRQFLMRIWLLVCVSMKPLQSSFPAPNNNTYVHTNNEVQCTNMQFHMPVLQLSSPSTGSSRAAWKEAGELLRQWHPEQGAQKSILHCSVWSDCYSDMEERAVGWQKMFITWTARRQQWKDQGLLKHIQLSQEH